MNDELRHQPIRPNARCCRAIEIIEAQSALSQHLCAPAAEAVRLGMHAERMGSAALILTRKSKNLMYNKLAAAGQASPARESLIERAIERARSHGVPALGVPVGDAARPRRLTAWLDALGFERGHPGAKLWRDAAPLSRGATSRTISVRVVAPNMASAWVDVVAQVWRTFGYRRPWFESRVATPGWRHYLAWIDGRPVGAGALYVGNVGSTRTGHLVDGVTLSPWRRRGVQTAIIRRRVADGRRLGCELFTSETAPPLPRMPLVSFRNLRRQGFELAYLRHSWRLNLLPRGR